MMHARCQKFSMDPSSRSLKMTATLSRGRPPTVSGSSHPSSIHHRLLPFPSPSSTNLVFSSTFSLCSPSPLHQVKSCPSLNPLPSAFLLPPPNLLLPQFTSPLLRFALLSCRPSTKEANECKQAFSFNKTRTCEETVDLYKPRRNPEEGLIKLKESQKPPSPPRK